MTLWRVEQSAQEKDCKWHRLYSQSDTHFCLITRLSNEPLYLFIGFPRQKNTIPLQDLHSYIRFANPEEQSILILYFPISSAVQTHPSK